MDVILLLPDGFALDLSALSTEGGSAGQVPIVTDIGGGVFRLQLGPAAPLNGLGLKYSVALPFFAVGQFFEVPMGRFPSTTKAWTTKLAVSGDAAFTVELAPFGGAYADMVGAGTAPATTGAGGTLDTDVTDWDDQAVPADSVLKVTCTVLTADQVTITFHFERT